MGLRIQDRGEVIKGAPVVEPGDHLFWFNRPHLLLFTIHLVLFQVISEQYQYLTIHVNCLSKSHARVCVCVCLYKNLILNPDSL